MLPSPSIQRSPSNQREGLLLGDPDKFAELPNPERCAILTAQAMEIEKLKAEVEKRQAERRTRAKKQKIGCKFQKDKLRSQENSYCDTTRIIAGKRSISYSYQRNSITSTMVESRTEEDFNHFLTTDLNSSEVLDIPDTSDFCNFLLNPHASEALVQHATHLYLLAQASFLKQINFQKFARMKEESG
eukprot:TRINITY_DN6979_c0_g2_i3.p1 TRINITY_DN6979_c0_g2~~TRINITY_DN6979_c0_g2_i3.p1  ORF type:complete len:187 (-),score=13.17 TRINITY_DN6979_c0_g2_i3:212-772(-)